MSQSEIPIFTKKAVETNPSQQTLTTLESIEEQKDPIRVFNNNGFGS